MNKKDCKIFIENLSKDVKKIDPSISLFIFGSFLREDFYPKASSDLDFFFIFEDNFITNKNNILSLSATIRKKNEKDLNLQMNLLDKGIYLDGRFLTFPKDYIKYFSKKSSVIKKGGIRI